jgi:predicted acetyltransferase
MSYQLILRNLSVKDEHAFLEGLKDWSEEDRSWFTFDWKPGLSFKDHLIRLEKNFKGESLENGHVASSMLYGFVGEIIVGRMSIRHALNNSLKTYGGHIGYAVAEKFRKNGYASEMMRQTLPICANLGLTKILATCDDTNIPSIKIIEKFGGKLEETIWDEKHKRFTRRYWIETL